MNKPELNSIWYCSNDKQTYKVVGITTIYTGDTGVELVRFIKSRNDWAKTPVCFSYLTDLRNDENPEEYSPHCMFYNYFTQA